MPRQEVLSIHPLVAHLLNELAEPYRRQNNSTKAEARSQQTVSQGHFNEKVQRTKS
ncbi:MAG TPA: hypothetical protein VH593_14850 [Ktedonobacteraceae bacterium]